MDRIISTLNDIFTLDLSVPNEMLNEDLSLQEIMERNGFDIYIINDLLKEHLNLSVPEETLISFKSIEDIRNHILERRAEIELSF